MRYQRSIPLPLFLATSIVLAALLLFSASPVTSQTPSNANMGGPSRQATRLLPGPSPTPAAESSAEVIKVDIDLVKVDALVLQKNTARIVGGLNKEHFLLYEDGIKQEITHFSQDELPLSVVIAIYRGPTCPHPNDVWSYQAHRAAREAIDRNPSRIACGHRAQPIRLSFASERRTAYVGERRYCSAATDGVQRRGDDMAWVSLIGLNVPQ